MTVGLTYDLRDDYLREGYSQEETAEFDKPDTIAAIEDVILKNGHATDRIGHVQALTRRLAAGDRWDLVFNIAEGLHGFGREAQVPALLDAYKIPYTFSDPLGQTLTLHKGMTKHVVRDLGIPTPDFVVVSDPEDIDQVSLPYPLFAKPVAEGTGKGITALSKIDNVEDLRNICTNLLNTFHQPVLVETYLSGREFTVGIVGTGKDARTLGAMEVILNPDAEQHAYSYDNKEHYENLVRYAAVDDAEARHAMEISLAAWRGLGLADGGRIDLRSDTRGIPHFIEVNSLAGLNPIRSDLPILCRLMGISYHQLITDILNSALKRAGMLRIC
ncbi:MAG: D-alanine--D-alanine ligase [Deltaproteobacteria bacterium HGW-Deltaproteobacteria-6]|nr:MAG: D-alanine--D-alanine ligase [Deltaproteobacteria bacterium HGW-Deltaproteobacteria-6]